MISFEVDGLASLSLCPRWLVRLVKLIIQMDFGRKSNVKDGSEHIYLPQNMNKEIG